MNDTSEDRKVLDKLCAEQQLAVLATDTGAGPYPNLVAFVATPDLHQFHRGRLKPGGCRPPSSTPPKSCKVRQSNQPSTYTWESILIWQNLPRAGLRPAADLPGESVSACHRIWFQFMTLRSGYERRGSSCC
ncbi:MAG: hypothetical protein H7Y05_03620 [Steroidobacteraceae bacterium]|nr:hypothetical protein [Deltaproteobacteria bacterium]